MPAQSTSPPVTSMMFSACAGRGIRVPRRQDIVVRGLTPNISAAFSSPSRRMKSGRSMPPSITQNVWRVSNRGGRGRVISQKSSQDVYTPGEASDSVPDAMVDYPRRIGARIRAAREGFGWTRGELAAKTGLLESRIGNYENGLRTPGPQEVVTLARALQERPAYLMGLEDEVALSPEEWALIRNLRTLPERDRLAYSRRIEQLAMVYREPVPDEDVERALGRPEPPKGDPRPRNRRRKTSP